MAAMAAIAMRVFFIFNSYDEKLKNKPAQGAFEEVPRAGLFRENEVNLPVFRKA
jgi:hypothetical protein